MPTSKKFLEIKNIYDLDKNFYGNSHCVNAFQASRYLCFRQKNYFQFLVCGDRRVDNLYKIEDLWCTPQSKHRAFTRFKNWFSFLGMKWRYRYCFLLKYLWLIPSKLSTKLCIERLERENSSVSLLCDSDLAFWQKYFMTFGTHRILKLF